MFANIRAVLGTNVAAMAIGFVSSIFVSRYLGPDGRGAYVLIIASGTGLAFLLGLGTNTACTFFAAKDREAVPSILRTQLAFTLSMALVALAGLLLLGMVPALNVARSYFLPGGVAVAPGVALVVAAFFLIHFNGSLSAVHNGQGRFHATNEANLTYQGILLGTALVLYLGFRDLPLEISVALLLVLPLGSQLLRLLDRHTISAFASGESAFSGDLLRRMVVWGTVPFAAGVLHFINNRVDFWFVDAFRGGGALGVYSLSASLAQLPWVIPTAVGTVLFPTFVGMSNAERRARLPLLIWTGVLGAAGVAAVGWAVAPSLLPLVYGQDFAGAVEPFRILLIGTVLLSGTTVAASFFISIDRNRHNVMGSLAGAVVTIALDIAVIPRFGIVGAAWTTNASYLVTSLLALHYLRREGFPLTALLHPRMGLRVVDELRRRRRRSAGQQTEGEDHAWPAAGDTGPERAAPTQDEMGRWEQIRSMIETHVHRDAPLRILDVGCGQGWLTHLLEEFGSTTGVDLMAEGVGYGRDPDPGADMKRGTAGELLAEAEPGSFDLIVSSGVLEHVQDKRGFVASLRTLVAGGGSILLTTPCQEVLPLPQTFEEYTHPVRKWLSLEEVSSLLGDAELEVIDHRIFSAFRGGDEGPLMHQVWLCRKPND